MSENKDAVREQIARDIKNYLARGKVIKKYRYNVPPTKGANKAVPSSWTKETEEE
jgi:hypothetical protein|tara:strand:- start:3440 stop:3604 length:165 start_codon:yes stop_codon:yes gene_type:complete